MDSGTLELFVREVGRQTHFARTAAADLRCAVGHDDKERIWYSIQSLLIATANISKLLWPSNNASSARGNQLRKRLKVPSDSPLASRDFRNHFEHFDERLEKSGISPEKHMVVDLNIGSLTSIKGGQACVYLRNYDPSTETLTFYREAYKLRPIIKAIEDLRSVMNGLS